MEHSTEAEARQLDDGPTAAEEINDDALATMAEAWAAEADRLFRLARGARAELLQRLVDRGAKVLDTPNWRGKVKPGPIHHAIDNVERFRQRLAPLVSDDALAKAFVQPPPTTPPMRADHRGINELVKLGGKVAAVIAEERKSQPGDPVLELERKEAADAEGPKGPNDEAPS